jgi:WxL domain surface cell wall-binding
VSLRKQLVGTVGALALVAVSSIPAFAAVPSDSEDVDIVVTSNGVLSVIVSETEPFDDINYSFSAQHSLGALTVTVTDLRGTAAGWTFNLRANGDFEGANTTDTIPVGGLGLDFRYFAGVAGATSTQFIIGSNISNVSTSGQQIANAPVGDGNGEYDFVYDGDLLVPGDTLVDTYTTTLTVEAAAAPN